MPESVKRFVRWYREKRSVTWQWIEIFSSSFFLPFDLTVLTALSRALNERGEKARKRNGPPLCRDRRDRAAYLKNVPRVIPGMLFTPYLVVRIIFPSPRIIRFLLFTDSASCPELYYDPNILLQFYHVIKSSFYTNDTSSLKLSI